MTPEEYYKIEFEKDYRLMKDIADAKLYSLNSMLQFAELYHKAEVKNLGLSDVIKCVCRSEEQYRNCDNFKCERFILDQ